MRFCCIFSHFMYHDLVTTFYIHCILVIYDDIWWCMFFSSPLSHMCCFFSLFIHKFFLVYNLSMFHTWCLDESCLSVLVKTGYKSTMPWSLFIHMFLLVYNLSMFHTWCLDESCLSVSVKTSCKLAMPWSLFLQISFKSS